MKNLFLIIGLFLVSITCNAQIYWESLLKNNRQLAHTQAKEELEKNFSIENLLALEIIRAECGRTSASTNFISKFSTIPDNQYYLYSLWNEAFIFGDYLNVGFDKTVKTNAGLIASKSYSDKTVSAALSYLQAIIARENNDFVGYSKHNASIPTIRTWQFCGVFENLNNSGLDKYYEPEDHPTNSIPFEANSNGFVNWYKASVMLNESYIFFNGHGEYGTGVHYAQTFFNNPIDRKATLRLAASANVKVWVNDVVVFETIKPGYTDIDAYLVELNLPKGNNRLLIKVAGQSSSDYFAARFTDDRGEFLSDITYSNSFNEYPKSTEEQLAPRRIESDCILYFKSKLKEKPSDFLYTYCLVNAYLRNDMHEEAKEILAPLYEANPKSSILRRLMINIYSKEENTISLKEVTKNLEKEDENYHLSLTIKFQDVNELFRMSISEMDKFLATYSGAYDNELITKTASLISSIRREDKVEIKSYLNDLVAESLAEEKLFLVKIYAPLYSSMLNDEVKYMKILETINKKYFDYSVRNDLVSYYDGLNKAEKALAILKENVRQLQGDFQSISDIVSYLHYKERYNESLPYIDQMLERFPYSFIAMEYKGDALLQTGKKQEAIEYYRKSVAHNSGNSSLRRKIEDINDEKDVIEDYTVKDLYAYVADNRNKGTLNNYGINILLNNAIIELYPESGGRARYTYVYEITSDEGVERIKEYNLGLSGDYNIIKSEIVKKDGSISPADKSGSRLVFTGLSIGDVVMIDYQNGFNSYGRFYKDFIDYFTFEGFHPIDKSNYTLIAPKNKKIDYLVTNDHVSFAVEEDDKNKIYKWHQENHPGLPQSEDYMPVLKDVAAIGHFSTIKNWNEVAIWYSDLVRSQMIIDNQVKKVFKEIFPEEDPTSLSENTRAERIYYYIMNNFNYSSVNFRQSGYVPQKPSKTINTKLGDCKDFSTLFVTFANMAGLQANLVLVLTSDNGQKSIILPNQDFNHCIAKVMIDGKEQFLELTDKFLPYKALPRSDRNASILEIPQRTDGGKMYDLRILTNPDRIKNTNTSRVEMYVTSEEQKFKINTQLTGTDRSYWAELFEKPNYEVYKKEVINHYQSNINSNVKVDTIYSINNKKEGTELSFSTELTLKEKLNKIGTYKILKIPYISSAYTGDIISEDDRKYPIDYLQYEGTDQYVIEFDIYLNEEGEFTEIPKDKVYTFKDHSYSQKYTKVSPKHLKIEIIGTPSSNTISAEEYAEFKSYVKTILEAKDEFVGYK